MSLIGKTLGERWQIRAPLGQGGMATVYRAIDLKEKSEVAVKIVSFSNASVSTELPRFRREFDICRKLAHPNVIKFHHFGSLDELHHFTIMDLVEGDDLSEVLSKKGPLDEKWVLFLAKKMASTLGTFHKEGIIHRDLKPANVMIVQGKNKGELEPIIMDFGLAKAIDSTAITETGAILGTPYYMSPEQARGEKVTASTDVYALGATVFKALTGKYLYSAHTIPELLMAINFNAPPYVSEVRPDVSRAWDDFVNGCLEKDPEDRLASMDEVLFALEKVQNALTSPAAHLSEVKRERKTAKTSAAKPVVMKKTDKRNLTLPIIAFALLLLFALLFAFLPRGEKVYSFSHLKVEPGLDRFVVTWQSEHPYPSVIQLSKPDKRRVQTDGKENVEHRVAVQGLEAGREYKFCLCYPNGKTSLPKSAQTREFSMKISSCKMIGGVLELYWQTKPLPARHRVLVGKDKFSIGPKGHIKIEKPTGKEKITALYNGGFQVERPLRQLALQESKKLATVLKTFSIKKANVEFLRLKRQNPNSLGISRVEKELTKNNEAKVGTLRRQKKTEKNKVIIQWAKGVVQKHRAVFDSWQEASHLSPLLLESNVLNLSEKNEFYQSLVPLLLFHALVAFDTSSEREVFPGIYLGAFACYGEKMRGPCLEVPIYSGSVSQGISLGIPIVAHRLVKRKWAQRFELNELSSFRAAEFAFHFDFFSKGHLRLLLNDKLSLVLTGDRTVMETSRRQFQRIPMEALRAGENRLELRYEDAGRDHFGEQSMMLNCTLRLRCR